MAPSAAATNDCKTLDTTMWVIDEKDDFFHLEWKLSPSSFLRGGSLELDLLGVPLF